MCVHTQSTEFETWFRSACNLTIPDILYGPCAFIKFRNDQLTDKLYDKYINIINNSCSKLNKSIIEYNQLCICADEAINNNKQLPNIRVYIAISIFIFLIIFVISCLINEWIRKRELSQLETTSQCIV